MLLVPGCCWPTEVWVVAGFKLAGLGWCASHLVGARWFHDPLMRTDVTRNQQPAAACLREWFSPNFKTPIEQSSFFDDQS